MGVDGVRGRKREIDRGKRGRERRRDTATRRESNVPQKGER